MLGSRKIQFKGLPDMFDLFGDSHSRYARRNRGNIIKAKFEAAGTPDKDTGPYGTMNLSEVFTQPVVKRGAEKVSKAKTGGDIGRNITDLLPVSMTRIRKVECCGESCTVRKRCA